MLNPDVLYLQSTPMTEPLLFGTTFLAVALIAEWCVAPAQPNSTPTRPTPTPARRRPIPDRRRLGRVGVIAAVLTRYEAWPIVAAAIGLAFVVLLRRGFTPVAALRAVRGLALWPLWALAAFLVNSKVSVGSWFVSGGFFVAENPALGTSVARVDADLGRAGAARGAGSLPWLAVVSAIGIVVASASR